MLKKLLVTLLASAFTLTAFAQAPKAQPATPAAPKAQTGVDTKKATPATPSPMSSKGVKKAKPKAKVKAKADEKKAATK